MRVARFVFMLAGLVNAFFVLWSAAGLFVHADRSAEVWLASITGDKVRALSYWLTATGLWGIMAVYEMWEVKGR